MGSNGKLYTAPPKIQYTTSPTVRATTMIQILNAAHLAYMVESPFEERNGIMIVGPPGTWKTTLITIAFKNYSDKSFHTDITTKQLVSLRSKMADGSIRSMLFEEFAKIFARTNAGAGVNVEKHIQALIEQGFHRASYEDSALVTVKAQAFVVGGLVYSEYEKRFTQWLDDGFARRWLWCHIIMEKPIKLVESVQEWKRIELGINLSFSQPINNIPHNVTPEESLMIRNFVQKQPGQPETAKLMHKILSVLKWRDSNKELKEKPIDLLSEFALTLGDVPARLRI
jgi:hypothetical protein